MIMIVSKNRLVLPQAANCTLMVIAIGNPRGTIQTSNLGRRSNDECYIVFILKGIRGRIHVMTNNSVMRRAVLKNIQPRVGMMSTTYIFHGFRGKNASHCQQNIVLMSVFSQSLAKLVSRMYCGNVGIINDRRG